MPEQDAIQRMQVWWVGLDPTTKAMFEQLYANDPAGVIAVVSGGEVPAREGTLGSFLDSSDPMALFDNIPTVQPAGAVSFEPAAPDANQAFVVSWSETNYSKVDCPEYKDLVQVFDGMTVVFEQSIDRPVLPAGGTAQGSLQVGGLPMAGYNVYVTMNVDGIDSGSGQPGTQGFKGYASEQVGVGGADVSGRPDSPASADYTNVSDAYMQLLNAYNARGEDSVRAVAQALYAFAGAVDPGGVVTDVEQYRNDLMVQTVQRAQFLEAMADRDLVGQGTDESFFDEVMAALQAIYPATVDPSRLQDSANDIQQAIVAIGQGSIR